MWTQEGVTGDRQERERRAERKWGEGEVAVGGEGEKTAATLSHPHSHNG